MPAAKLIGGPYHPPACAVGDWLPDEIDGLLQVGGWTNARIPWPRRKKTGRHSPILCGDLVRAVRAESSEAVQYWWGVGPVTVAKWRRALGVPQDNTGTRLLRQARHPGIPPEAAARGRAKAASPESRAKMAQSKRGQPMHPNTAAALRQAVTKPKPPGWGQRANQWMRAKKGS